MTVETHTKNLTLRQERFVAEYIHTGNATQSAKKAGYAHPHVHGARLLANVRVKSAIDTVRAEIMENAEDKLARYVARLEAEAEDDGNSDGSRIRALELLIKVVGGFAPEKQEVHQFHGAFLADLDLDEPELPDFNEEIFNKNNSLQ